MNDDVSRARAESAALLNLNPDELSPAAALKCDLVSALRAVLDDELAKATSGSGADLNRLVVAVEHLVGFLKEANPAKGRTTAFPRSTSRTRARSWKASSSAGSRPRRPSAPKGACLG